MFFSRRYVRITETLIKFSIFVSIDSLIVNNKLTHYFNRLHQSDHPKVYNSSDIILSGTQQGIVWKVNNNIEGNDRGIIDNNKDNNNNVWGCPNCCNHHKEQSKLFELLKYWSLISQAPLTFIFLLFYPWLIIYSAHNTIICRMKKLFVIHTKPKYFNLLSLPPKCHRERQNIKYNTRRHHMQYQLQF